MAKFKAAGRKKAKAAPRAAAIPCLVIVCLIFILISITIYFAFKAGS